MCVCIYIGEAVKCLVTKITLLFRYRLSVCDKTTFLKLCKNNFISVKIVYILFTCLPPSSVNTLVLCLLFFALIGLGHSK